MSVNANNQVVRGSMNPLQQQQYTLFQQQQAQALLQAELEQKKLQDMIDALSLVSSLRNDMNSIVASVGRQTVPPESSRTADLERSVLELERVLAKMTPVVVKDAAEFIPVLMDQSEASTGNKLMNNYRWVTKVQELINSTSLPVYKRYGQAYHTLKSTKYKSYSIKMIKKEELDKYVSQHLTHNEIKVITAQRTDNQFVLDIIMPQHFKFVFLLFDCNVETLQVRALDMRLLKIYSANKPSNDICTFDFEHTHSSKVLAKLEDNCLFACAHFRTEHGVNHFRYILQWIKNYTNLFNAKCQMCEKHLLNGLPPTWRDLKTYEAFHEECRL